MRDELSRFNFNADVTRYVNWRGQHTIKAGVQFERIVDDMLSGEQAATVQLFWDQSYALNDGRRLRGHVRLLQRRPLRTRRRHRVEQRRPVRAGRVDAQPQADTEPRRADRARGRAVLPSRQPRRRLRLRRQDCAARRVCLGRQRRQPVEGLRQLGRLLRPDEADRRPRHVRRRQLDELLLHARLPSTGRRSRAATAQPGSGCPGTFITQFDFRPVANNPTTTSSSIPISIRRARRS